MSTPENGRNFSVKDILTEFVLPRLDSIEGKLDKKADAAVVDALRSRVETIERGYLTRDEKHDLENKIGARFLLVEQDVAVLKEERAGRAFLSSTQRFWLGTALIALGAAAAVLALFH